LNPQVFSSLFVFLPLPLFHKRKADFLKEVRKEKGGELSHSESAEFDRVVVGDTAPQQLASKMIFVIASNEARSQITHMLV
jgi:predicted nucleic-acid-binding protein